jgi:hypothetical protein
MTASEKSVILADIGACLSQHNIRREVQLPVFVLKVVQCNYVAMPQLLQCLHFCVGHHAGRSTRQILEGDPLHCHKLRRVPLLVTLEDVPVRTPAEGVVKVKHIVPDIDDGP